MNVMQQQEEILDARAESEEWFKDEVRDLRQGLTDDSV